MCGIYLYSKYFDNSKNNFEELLIHRGPNFQKKIVLDDFIIGHNLLSIRGEFHESKQPVIIQNRYYLSFNGEIYNSDEIADKFNLDKSSSDTQILSLLIEQKGTNFIRYIKGMYAIILFDNLSKEINIYRDHSGQKNVYYYRNNQKIAISSEIFPITQISNFNNEVNYEYIYESLTIGHPLNDNTIFSKISKLLPGQSITFDQNGKIKKSFISIKETSKEFLDQSIYECIDETIKNHTLSNSKVGINLSAGLDSNIVLYHSIKHKSNIEAFSTFFENSDEKYNIDFLGAKKAANHYGIKFNETLISKNDYEDNFFESFTQIEEINRNAGNSSYLINYKNQKKNNFKTIISGDGGDEIFIGYDWYFKGRFREKLFKNISLISGKLKNYFYLFNYLSQFDRYKIFNKKKFINLTQKNYKIFSKISSNLDEFIKANFDNKLYNFNFFKLLLDQYLWLPNEILMRADKLGMSQSLEIRNPFCDQDLRKKLFKEMKNEDFKTEINKFKLRNIYQDKLPKFTFDEKKKYGWTTPHEWIKSEKINSIILDSITNTKSDFFDWNSIKKEIKSNKDIMLNRSMYPLISLIFLNKKFNLNL